MRAAAADPVAGEAIAIVGAACRLPGGIDSLATLWSALSTGRDLVSDNAPPERFSAPHLLGGRFVPRVTDLPAAVEETSEGDTLRISDVGMQYRLAWTEAAAPAPGPDEVLIEVRAVALNYRDILLTTGLLPATGGAAPLAGLECAGVVEAAGASVTGLQPGDPVFAMTPGCAAFGSRVVAPAGLVARMPDGMSFPEAATLPVAWLTVHYGLGVLARLSPGETVLVHGGAGGVGLAAIQYATGLGAQVFASAGAETKRDLLHLLGAEQVFDSRRLDFAAEVAALTGGRGVDDYLPTVGQLFAPGELYSYNNSGYSLLGRIVEVLRGKPYRQVLRERLVAPLGLRHVATRADEAILFRTSVGHLRSGTDGNQSPARRWRLPDSNEPSGAMLAMSAHDLLQFARMHLRDGLAPDGTRVVSRSSIQAMREPQVPVPKLNTAEVHWGLGTRIDQAGLALIAGHDGDNIGQYAMLRMVPDRDLALVLFCNGGNAGELFRAVSGHLLAALAGLEAPRRLTPPAEPRPADPHRYLGRYQAAAGGICTVEAGGSGDLWLTHEPPRSFAEFLRDTAIRLRTVRYYGDTFVTAEASGFGHQSFAFLGDDGDGQAKFIHNGRALRRLA